MIDKIYFDNYEGQDCYLYVLHGDGIEVGVTDFGAAVQFIKLKTKRGVRDVALGYPTIAERLASGTFCGATIGRVSNRIKNSKFVLNGKEYNITANDGNNCNHGGKEGFHMRLFKAEPTGDILKLTLLSPDGDQGFPGNLELCVEYELVGKTLEIRYSAVSDKDTLWAPTGHTYFNLNGEDSGSVLDSVVKINSEKITLLDEEHIVTGETAYVAGTPFDFTRPRPIGISINADDEQLVWAGGYDVNFILNGKFAASAFSAASGVKLDVYSDLPGLQLYTGNYLQGSGKSGQYRPRDGFCLEPQFVPNSCNLAKFAQPVLTANKESTHFIKYKFTIN